MRKLIPVVASAILAVAGAEAALAQSASPMTFFVTSAGSGKGADLGGLAGADQHCQTLAAAAGAGSATWRAYLSADAADGRPAVNARDRIGNGPWTNAKGVQIAANVADLHSDNNKISKDTALSEKGEKVNGRGDTPNTHDVMTGSNADGTLAAGKTCSNWTSSGDGTAMLGHHDRTGTGDPATSASWNAAHQSRGCSQPQLVSTGGAGLFYCFAVR